MKGKSESSVLWWIVWIALSILAFFGASYFWTEFISVHVGNIHQKGVAVLWVTAVFGTWMILLVPLIVIMYNKVDRAYEEARVRREAASGNARRTAANVKFDPIPEAERLLSQELVKKVRAMPWTIKLGNLVTVALKDGRRIENVFVLDRREVVGVYGYDKAPFRTKDIADVFEAGTRDLPNFETDGWLRLDGAP